VKGLSQRQLAYFCRVLAMLVMEPEVRTLPLPVLCSVTAGKLELPTHTGSQGAPVPGHAGHGTGGQNPTPPTFVVAAGTIEVPLSPSLYSLLLLQ